MKQYRCIPLAIGIPILFAAYVVVCLLFAWKIFMDDNPSAGYFMIFMALFSLSFAIFTAAPAVRRVEIGSDKVVCYGLFPHDTITIDYSECFVGMDYHIQNGNKIWWIYLCIGPYFKYVPRGTKKRINSVKFQPGFIRLWYSDEVYQALIDVLPKNHRTSLITARNRAGFDKQGSIIF